MLKKTTPGGSMSASSFDYSGNGPVNKAGITLGLSANPVVNVAALEYNGKTGGIVLKINDDAIRSNNIKIQHVSELPR